nr:type II secretion system protein GspM [Aurantimonas manganoxydans]
MRWWARAAVGCLAPGMLILALNEYRLSQDIATETADKSNILADLRHRVASAPMSAPAGASEDRPGFYIAGDTVPIAEATLQNILTRIVEDHGGAVSQVEFLTQQEDTDRRATLRLSFLAKLENVQDILYDIESRQPLMLISSLSLRGSSTDGDVPDGEDMLRTVVAVEGYLSPEGN